VIIEAHSILLATILTGGNRNDVTQLVILLEVVPPIRGFAANCAGARSAWCSRLM
jgi:hypothetical protein